MLDSGAPADKRDLGDWQRVTAGLAGAALIVYALARPSLFRTLLAAAGAVLLERSVAGHGGLDRVLGFATRLGAETRRYGNGGERSVSDRIHQASEDSFPASDPPSWTRQRAGSPRGAG